MIIHVHSSIILQADDPESMMSWISAIQANNNPDEDVSVLCIVFHGVQDYSKLT